MASKKKTARTVVEIAFGFFNEKLAQRLEVGMRLRRQWAQIVGAELAHQTAPLGLSWSKKSAEEEGGRRHEALLSVGCSRLAALQMPYHQDKIIKRVNSFLGYPAVHKIKAQLIPLTSFSQKETNAQPQKSLTQQQEHQLQSEVCLLKDEGLRGLMYELGEQIYKKQPE